MMRRFFILPILACLASCATPQAAAPTLPSALEAGWMGERTCQLLHETATHRVLRCTFPPGVGHERHFHPPHFAYALSGGRMQITDAQGTRTTELATGSSYSNPGIAWHEGLNVGETTVIYLIVEER